MALRFDSSDIAAIPATLNAIEARFGIVSILVNNAGIVEGQPIDEVTPDAFDAVFGLNVRGGFFLGQAVAARMMAAKMPGRIINIGSTLGRRQPLRAPVYSMSKATVFQMTRMMAHAWAHAGINVNCIAPGMVRSDYNRDMIASEAGRQAIAAFPRKRVAEPEQLGGLLLYLASDASEIMTGDVFEIDDGQSIAR
jgi:NAD(P)-dependent dehydrogenase (short-subunit alcohol dehydrogenase family)